MKNYVQDRAIIRATAPYDRTSGQGAKIGSMFGVAMIDILSGVVGEFAITGVFDLAKATGAITEGAIVYWDDSAKNVTTTSSSNTKIGVCVLNDADGVPASGDATARVMLNSSF